MEDVSIVIPVYNTPEQYFCECMDSLLEQTYRNFEVIIIDDGSIESVGILCDKYAERDKRFRVVHQKNQGLPAARNTGTAMAAGRWIIYLDPDDWLEKDTLARSVRTMQEKDVDILVFGYYDHYPDNNIEKHYCCSGSFPYYLDVTNEQKTNMQLGLMDESIREMPGYFGSACMHMAKMELINREGIRFDENVKKSEDMLYDLEILDKACKVGVLNIPLYHYRHHSVSACNKYNPDIENIIATLFDKLNKFVSDKQKEYRQAFCVYLMKNYINILRLKYFHKDNQDCEQQKRKQWHQMIRNAEYLMPLRHINTAKITTKRKMWGILHFLSFRMKNYHLLKIAYNMYYYLKKEWI